jgi:hypothetical protein
MLNILVFPHLFAFHSIFQYQVGCIIIIIIIIIIVVVVLFFEQLIRQPKTDHVCHKYVSYDLVISIQSRH